MFSNNIDNIGGYTADDIIEKISFGIPTEPDDFVREAIKAESKLDIRVSLITNPSKRLMAYLDKTWQRTSQGYLDAGLLG